MRDNKKRQDATREQRQQPRQQTRDDRDDSPREGGALPDCVGSECYKCVFSTQDPVAEYVKIVHAGETTGDTYPMPAPDSGIYGVGYYVALREAFEAEARKRMADYAKPLVRGCGKGCRCVYSTDPKDTITTVSRERVKASYTYPDKSGTATITGTFELTIKKTRGICTRRGDEDKAGKLPPDDAKKIEGK
ncbi:MAG: hypothetical protein LC746_16280 [Acidobacteria bacterium]|nr:hypothetical protein [Acidobacteriota bacterium]